MQPDCNDPVLTLRYIKSLLFNHLYMNMRFTLLAVLLLLFSCQQIPAINEKSEPSHIRRAEPSNFGVHEHRAKTFPQHYILEGRYTNKTVSLTFDDGPSHHTIALLKILKKHRIHATFFMLGDQMQQYPDIVTQVLNDGHEIANHSWDHDDMLNYPNLDEFWRQQINKQRKISQSISGKTPLLFRPPFGRISDQQVQFLAERNIKTIIWSIDTQDWNEKTNSVTNLVSSATEFMHPEAIILMHDGGGNRKNTIDALDNIISHYLANNYTFVTVSTLLNTPAYENDLINE